MLSFSATVVFEKRGISGLEEALSSATDPPGNSSHNLVHKSSRKGTSLCRGDSNITLGFSNVSCDSVSA